MRAYYNESTKSLKSKLQSLKKELDEEKCCLEASKKERGNKRRLLDKKQMECIKKNEEIRNLRKKYENLKTKFEKEYTRNISRLRESLSKHEEEKKTLEIKRNARKKILEEAKSQKDMYDKLCQKKEEMDRQIRYLCLAKENLTKENYQSFLEIKKSPYPVDGSDEEKLAWFAGFGKFIEFLENSM